MATYKLFGNKILLELTRAEARGLAILAGNGAEGMLTDPVSARDWVGPAASVAAARRALDALEQVAYRPAAVR